MHKYELIKVNIDQIDQNDESYVFTFSQDLSRLLLSIKQGCIVSPPLLEQRTDDKYRIISGSKRVSVLTQLNIDNITANVIVPKSENPSLDNFLLNLYDNIGTRTLNPIEKANILHKLINLFHQPRETVIKKYLPILELGSHPNVIDRYLLLIELESQIKKAVAEEFISVEIAQILVSISKEDRLSIFNLFDQLKPGKNNQKEFIRFLEEIKIISGKLIVRILDDEEIQIIFKNQKLTSGVKINRIKEVLKKRRYPVYKKVEEKFFNIKSELKLPPNITLRSPAFFESEKYIMEMSFKNQTEFNESVKLLYSIADSKKIALLEKLV